MTQKIRNMIRDALADEERTGRLARTMRDIARQNGAHPTDQQVAQAVEFAQQYVDSVPHFLDEGAARARQAGIGSEFDVLYRELESYWLEANDVIPDHQGLLGILDDAYASLTLLQALSDYTSGTVGRALLEQDLKVANQTMRNLIGEPAVSILDQRVGVTLGQALMQRTLEQVARMPAFGFGAGPFGSSGYSSIEEEARIRLGAMGVV